MHRLSQKSVKSITTALTSLTSDAGGVNRLSLPSLASQQTDVSNISFNELVSINDEGHPYIDINRLMYRPTVDYHHADDKKKEKLSWYLPDFAFIVFNLMSLCVSTYFCLVGTSSLTWKASTGMFSVPACWAFFNDTKLPSPEREESFYYLPCERFTVKAGNDFKENLGYDFHKPNSFPILRTKLTDAHYFGLVLICLELINLINVIVGINACLQGYKAILIQHITVDGLIILGEFIISAVVAFTSVCDKRDLRAIRVILKNFIYWYGTIIKSPEDETDKEKQIHLELDSLQLGLGCCGVDGWIDYLANRYPDNFWHQGRTQLDETESLIPYSCCRSWWIRNVYCSHGVHRWAHPFATEEMITRFQERIVQDGCMYKLEKLCLNLRSLMGQYGFIATLIHLLFTIIEAISALVIIKNINNLIRENKRQMRRKEILHDEEGSEQDVSVSTWTGRKSGSSKENRKSVWSNIPPPTEDEIMLIKQRSNFNKFMSKVKGTDVGNWMKQAQEIVTEGHVAEHENITAEEKKQRERELLHGKAKQAARDHDEANGDDKTKRNVKPKRQKLQKAVKKKENVTVARDIPEKKKSKSLEEEVPEESQQEPEPPPPPLTEEVEPETEINDKDIKAEITKRKRRRRRRKKTKPKKPFNDTWSNFW